MKEIKLNDLGDLLLRLLSRPKHYHGTIEIKYFDGEIKNIRAEDSFDINYLKEKTLKIVEGDTEMSFLKFGKPNKKDKNSSKILSELELDGEQKIVKESKIEKKKEEEIEIKE